MRELPRTWTTSAAAVLGILVLVPSLAFPQGRPDTGRADLTRDFLIDVALGRVAKHHVIHQSGSSIVNTTLRPVTRSGFYRTPTSAVALEVLSDDVNDTAAGIGAQELTVYGLGSDWTEVTQVVELSGTTPVPLPVNLIRLYHWKVSRSGSYADQDTPSQVGTLTVRAAGGGDIWSTGSFLGGLGAGESRIGVLTVPAGVTAYVTSYHILTYANRIISIYLFQRDFADDVTPPYTGTLRVVRDFGSISGPWTPVLQSPDGPFVGPCDLGFMAIVSAGEGGVSVSFEVLYVED